MKKDSALEPNGSFEKDLLHWYITYLINKLETLSKRTVKDSFDEEGISLLILFSNSIDDLYNNANIATRQGLKAMGAKVAHLKELYDFITPLSLSSMGELGGKPIEKFFHENPSMKNRDASTQQQYYLTILNLFKFIEEKSGVAFPIGFKLAKRLKKDKDDEVPQHLSIEEFEQFSKAVDRMDFDTPFETARNRLILGFLLYSGIKPVELTRLKLSDVHNIDSNGDIIIDINSDLNDESAKRRSIPVARDKILRPLKDYIALREVNESETLFYSPSDKETKLNPDRVAPIIARAFDSAGIAATKNLSQLLRNSFAVYLVAKGVPLKSLQTLLGLESILMATVYATIQPEKEYRASDIFN